jgi:hypothetical protein
MARRDEPPVKTTKFIDLIGMSCAHFLSGGAMPRTREGGSDKFRAASNCGGAVRATRVTRRPALT